MSIVVVEFADGATACLLFFYLLFLIQFAELLVSEEAGVVRVEESENFVKIFFAHLDLKAFKPSTEVFPIHFAFSLLIKESERLSSVSAVSYLKFMPDEGK